MNTKENILRTIRFDRPAYIPMVFHINEACWSHYPTQALEELIAEHPFLFPTSTTSLNRQELESSIPERVGRPFTDGWGCIWETSMNGIVGTVTQHPLQSWDNFETYPPPNPDIDSGKGTVDWPAVRAKIEASRENNELTIGGLRHGHTFMQLCDLRGYENLTLDMYDDDPRLVKLIDRVETFNAAIIQHYLDIGVDMMTYAEDLGMQSGPMIAPDMFRRYIKPSYERLMAPAIEAGCIIHMHSDGHIQDLINDLIGGGVAVMNLQDLVNGLDWIAENLKGRICIELDIDRQEVTPRGTPQQIDKLIHTEVEKLGAKEGGLMMIYGLYPGVPLENIKALMDAMEHYAFHYSS